ncbi:NF038130 family PEP-CTERM protein [Nostoc sp. FACHB-152]|uniref:NF038130 family PEP-CTERM protein n=1 Tax=unclassified Nostoc TaxID=2593658 RepID=UPI001687B4F4|nr:MULTISPECIES: NF038130 family PEP-CTERM protein [unclassified Nostoc]MBD2446266.1 NF038130 family PEP-CTERM protein [Nostoc sp. FACHB-152]MBD2469536.1 NF038130 family PEP-CTERM protein [Nostoc sp. FACHB-145]
MATYIKKVLIGTSIAASITTLSTSAAFATGLTRPTNIQFTTNGVANTSAPNINSWNYAPGAAVYDNTGIGGVNRQVLNDYSNKGSISKATAALTDNDRTTNVELFTSGETVTDHVGFTANLGKNTIKIESVTKADWADGTLATGWLTGFRDTYGGLMSGITTTPGSNMLKDFNSNFTSLVSYLSTNGFNAAGDPNIGDVSYNQATKDLKIDLVGHLDLSPTIVDTRKTVIDTRATIIDTRKTIVVSGKTVANPTYNKSIPNPTYNKSVTNPNYLGVSPDFSRNSTGNVVFDTMLFKLAKTALEQNTPFQFSEIAKVNFNNQVSYAYGFSAVDSGAIAGDRAATDTTSHTGIYSWTKNYKNYQTAPVPEPSALIGLMAIGGLVVARRKGRKNVSFE